MILQVENLTKRFGEIVAVDGLSFEVDQGEIFGLLGPNGAGKTTTIRMVLDILPPDEGRITVLGQRPGDAQHRVGYLPEERGLYRNRKVLEMLAYLAELKGTDRDTAQRRANALLGQMGLEDRAESKVRDLSRGMQQRLQLIASVVHDPDLIFLDEPFQGLDPVNVERIKGFIADLAQEGKTVVLSTHQMNLVEALCDRILLINRGRSVLYGPLTEIKHQFAPHAVRVQSSAIPAGLPGVISVEQDNGAHILHLAEGVSPQSVLRTLVDSGAEIQMFEVSPVPLEDIFVQVVTGS